MKRTIVPAVLLLTVSLFSACTGDKPKNPKVTAKHPTPSSPTEIVNGNPEEPGTEKPTPPDATNPPPDHAKPAPPVPTPPTSVGEIPYAKPVPGKPGFVFSPYEQYKGYIDVRGFPPGTEVKDPYSGKSFLVP